VDNALDTGEVELYLLRHAHAGNPAEWTGDDAQRPLSTRGRRQAERLGQFLAERAFAPDAIVSSPLLRARQTAERIADSIGIAVTIDARLAAPLDLDVVGSIIAGVGGTSIVLVGHDPDFSELAATLSGVATLPLRKGALARFDVTLPLEPGAGTLRWLLPPDLILDRS
jgi:phosphohistidine phosphatase